VDAAVANADAIDAFLRQSMDEVVPATTSWQHLAARVASLGGQAGPARSGGADGRAA
jgi:flagellum-specific ATP synthase